MMREQGDDAVTPADFAALETDNESGGESNPVTRQLIRSTVSLSCLYICFVGLLSLYDLCGALAAVREARDKEIYTFAEEYLHCGKPQDRTKRDEHTHNDKSKLFARTLRGMSIARRAAGFHWGKTASPRGSLLSPPPRSADDRENDGKNDRSETPVVGNYHLTLQRCIPGSDWTVSEVRKCLGWCSGVGGHGGCCTDVADPNDPNPPVIQQCQSPVRDVCIFSDTTATDIAKMWKACQGPSSDEGNWEYAWRQHGSCTGLTAAQYFSLTSQFRSHNVHLCSTDRDEEDCNVCINSELGVSYLLKKGEVCGERKLVHGFHLGNRVVIGKGPLTGQELRQTSQHVWTRHR